jgi:hypothetical protein
MPLWAILCLVGALVYFLTSGFIALLGAIMVIVGFVGALMQVFG